MLFRSRHETEVRVAHVSHTGRHPDAFIDNAGRPLLDALRSARAILQEDGKKQKVDELRDQLIVGINKGDSVATARTFWALSLFDLNSLIPQVVETAISGAPKQKDRRAAIIISFSAVALPFLVLLPKVIHFHPPYPAHCALP